MEPQNIITTTTAGAFDTSATPMMLKAHSLVVVKITGTCTLDIKARAGEAGEIITIESAVLTSGEYAIDNYGLDRLWVDGTLGAASTLKVEFSF